MMHRLLIQITIIFGGWKVKEWNFRSKNLIFQYINLNKFIFIKNKIF